MSSIEWTDVSWNPVRGCSRVSRGCENCYAEKIARRFSGPGKPYEGLVRIGKDGKPKAQWNGAIKLVHEKIVEPLKWSSRAAPKKVFVNSMSDLFHPGVPDGFVMDVFRIIRECPQHTFQILTKRPKRMLAWFRKWSDVESGFDSKLARGPEEVRAQHSSGRARLFADMIEGWGKPPSGAAHPLYDWAEGPRWWPSIFPNAWIGVSVEDQATADQRIPLLLECPAAVRFVSYEPALGPVSLERIPGAYKLDQFIVGGESGPGARPFDIEWGRRAIGECRELRIKPFMKQLGARPFETVADRERAAGRDPRGYVPGVPAALDLREPLNLNDRKGGDMSEWPADLRVREFPRGGR